MWDCLINFFHNIFGIEDEEDDTYLAYNENEFYWAGDELPQKEDKGIWLWILLALWAVFFVIGIFSTPIINGKPEVAPIELRLERDYIENIQIDIAFSDNLSDAIEDLTTKLQNNEIDSFTFSSELNSILDALDKKMGSLKVNDPPERFKTLHNVVLEMFNYQAMMIQELSAYAIDNDSARIDKINSFLGAYQQRRAKLEEQIGIIKQDLGLS